VSRRTVARGAAWSAPVVAVAYAAPAFAVSFVDPVNSCWQGSFGTVDLHYLGPIDRIANAAFRESTNGTCAGNGSTFPTVVRASTFAEANGKCMTLLNKPTSGQVNQIGYPGAPAQLYLCGNPPL
jgi:hypothetical protein